MWNSVVNSVVKFTARAADEYVNRPEVSANVHSIPVIGPIVDYAFRIAASETQMRRFNDLIVALKEEIGLVDMIKIDKPFLESEEAYDLYRKMFIVTLETMNKEKIHLYARILVRSAILDNARFRYYSKDFISLLLELSPPDLGVAREIYKRQEKIPADIEPGVDNEVQLVKKKRFL